MHDDDVPMRFEPEEPESYWTEEQWERFMLENEKLMDRYEQVRKENPDRRWDDPLDLYHKVHYDLDLGEESEHPAEPPESVSDEPSESSEEAGGEEPELPEKEDFHDISVYQLAYAFSLAVYDYLKRAESGRKELDPIHQQLALHGLRIAADIAGGHGLGYDEETLCGNIVKNRWALGHAVEARRLCDQLIERDGPIPDIAALQAQLLPIIKTLEERIAELRARVWWNR